MGNKCNFSTSADGHRTLNAFPTTEVAESSGVFSKKKNWGTVRQYKRAHSTGSGWVMRCLKQLPKDVQRWALFVDFFLLCFFLFSVHFLWLEILAHCAHCAMGVLVLVEIGVIREWHIVLLVWISWWIGFQVQAFSTSSTRRQLDCNFQPARVFCIKCRSSDDDDVMMTAIG